MNDSTSLLWMTVLMPLCGAIVIGLAPKRAEIAKGVALLVSLLTLYFVASLVLAFVKSPADDFASSQISWMGDGAGFNVALAIGLDGLSIWLFALSSLLVFTSVLVSWEAIREQHAGFYAALLVLSTGMLGVFAARDVILFYVFFEFTLIPLFFLIGIWGSEDRRYAAIKFFIFTLAGSMLTFVGLLSLIIYNYMHPASGEPTWTFSISELTSQLAAAAAAGQAMPTSVQVWIFLALFAGFAIKVPLFPLHTWLPLAHVQAPTAGSVLLAGVLLKIGTYGFLRFSIPMLPTATAILAPYLLWLSAAGIIYGALVALAQKDIKRLIAYSSVSHLGYCMLGLFALNQLGIEGGTLQTINHGLSTGGLFACVGMLYERYHTREIAAYGGIARRLPVLTFFMLVFTMSSIGLPGLNGFAGEFLLLIGMFQRGFADAAAGWEWQLQVITVLALLGVVLGAWYMLWLIERVFFGPLKEPGGDHSGDPPADLRLREIMALAPLVVFIFWIGLRPQTFLAPMQATLRSNTERAIVAYDQQTNSAQMTSSSTTSSLAVRQRQNSVDSGEQRP